MAFLKFWLQEKFPLFVGFSIFLVFGIFFSANFIRTEIDQFSGIATAHVRAGSPYPAGDLQLAVKLDAIGLVYVPTGSITQVSIGSRICVAKTSNIIGSEHFILRHQGNCT